MRFSFVRIFQWLGVAAGLFLLVGLNYEFDSEAGMRMNAPVEDPLSQGLLGYWKMDEGTGTSTTADSSGNANTLSLTGPPTWTTGNIGPYALDFSGTGQYLSVADPASGVLDFANGASFSITGWFNRDTFANDHTIVAKKNDQSTSSETGYIVWVDNGSPDTLCLAVYGTAGYTVCSTSDLGSSGWHHFAISWNDAATTNPVKIYIDGADNTGTPTGTFSSVASLANARAFAIGAESDAGNPFDGKIDDIRLYGYALSTDEVAKLYQVTSPAQPVDTGLVGHWTFDGPDIKGTTAIDRSGKGNNGTRTGTTPTIGKLGQGLSFNGSSDTVYVPNNGTFDNFNAGTQSKTISLWTYFNATTNSMRFVFMANVGHDLLDFTYQKYATDYLAITCEGGTVESSTSINIQSRTWYMFTVVIHDGTADFYINGASIGDNAASFSNASYSNNYLYFASYDGSSNFFDGRMDDIRIYNRALSSSEIINLYNAGK